MFEHIVVIASSYILGKRIAWHYSDKEIGTQVLTELKDKTKQILGRADYSIHKLSTESKSWESVIARDSFFADFEIYKDLDEFLVVISEDKKITALDIAKLLLSMQPMSNLKLQKMIYLVYANYLKHTKKPLFEEKVVAYQYGPVVEVVYEHYKVHGRDEIKEESVLTLDEITIPLALAKVLQSSDYVRVLKSVTETLESFGSKSAYELVNLTHRKGSPWYKTSGYYGEITDDLILSCHDVELS